ncbi:hypothetical protein [Aurantimonas sp. Leaf443]|nr:hypothetical protein [Aurantimonas sp. Leaf443]
MLTPVIPMAGIASGVFIPTEAAAVAGFRVLAHGRAVWKQKAL